MTCSPALRLAADQNPSTLHLLLLLLLLLNVCAGFTAAVWPTKTPLPPSGQLYDSTVTFNVIADVGVVLFMFMLGAELDHHRYAALFVLHLLFKSETMQCFSLVSWVAGVGMALLMLMLGAELDHHRHVVLLKVTLYVSS
jgi:hypothetical protein